MTDSVAYIVEQYVKRYYTQRDYRAFKMRSLKSLLIHKEIKYFISLNKFVITQLDDKKLPSKTCHITFDKHINGEFEAYYKTVLKISKVAPLFYMQHEFSVEHKNENKIDSFLNGFWGGAYTKDQFILDEKIRKVLIKKGYFDLKWTDMIMSVHGISLPKEHQLSSCSYVTIQDLLFNDIFNICTNE